MVVVDSFGTMNTMNVDKNFIVSSKFNMMLSIAHTHCSMWNDCRMRATRNEQWAFVVVIPRTVFWPKILCMNLCTCVYMLICAYEIYSHTRENQHHNIESFHHLGIRFNLIKTRSMILMPFSTNAYTQTPFRIVRYHIYVSIQKPTNQTKMSL